MNRRSFNNFSAFESCCYRIKQEKHVKSTLTSLRACNLCDKRDIILEWKKLGKKRLITNPFVGRTISAFIYNKPTGAPNCEGEQDGDVHYNIIRTNKNDI